jgi:hypothetical protein
MARGISVSVLSLGLGWLACVGCGSDSSDEVVAPGSMGGGPSEPSGGELPYAPCPAETGVGEFLIELSAEFTSAGGKVFDGVTPGLIPTEIASEGECRLLTPPSLLCDPGCPVSTQTCGTGNQCVPLPVAHDLGTASVTGLLVPVEMRANAATGNYTPTPTRLPHPAFETGAELTLSTTGGDYAPLVLRGRGVSLLEVTEPILVSTGADTSLAWVAPEAAGPARLHVNLNVNNHGSSTAWIECDFPDTGSALIPAALIDGLIAQGSSGFPTMTLTRRTATSTLIEPGCVQLLVASSVSKDVSLSGLTSCNDDSMCPAGQACRAIERFCE